MALKKIVLKEIKQPITACLQCYGCSNAPMAKNQKRTNIIKSPITLVTKTLVTHV